MKKLVALITVLLWAMAANAWAIPYIETWQSNEEYAGGTGQYMATGDWVGVEFNFEDDTQDVYSSFDDTSLEQSENEYLEYAHPDWRAGWVDFKFWSGDDVTENAQFDLYSYGSPGLTQDLGTYQIDTLNDLGDGYWGLTLYMDEDALDLWFQDAFGKVEVEATKGNFLLTSVSMSLDPVPEPATMVLLGLGLVGLAGLKKKLAHKNLKR